MAAPSHKLWSGQILGDLSVHLLLPSSLAITDAIRSQGFGRTFFTLPLFFQQSLLLQPHTAETPSPKELRSTEDHMQERGGYLERKSPAVPQRAKKPHDGHSLENGASEGAGAAETEHLARNL